MKKCPEKGPTLTPVPSHRTDKTVSEIQPVRLYTAQRDPERTDFKGSNRARVHLVDAVLAFVMLVSVIALYPWLMQMFDMAANRTNPLSGTLLQLTFYALIISLLFTLGTAYRSAT